MIRQEGLGESDRSRRLNEMCPFLGVPSGFHRHSLLLEMESQHSLPL